MKLKDIGHCNATCPPAIGIAPHRRRTKVYQKRADGKWLLCSLIGYERGHGSNFSRY
ncbi:MAG: hypothetical protein ACT6FD_03430 [Methanosarcinaceae archaeon]